MEEDAADKAVSKQISLSPAARRVIDTVNEKYGVTKVAAAERGLEFLLTLPDAVLQEVFRRDGDPIGTLVRIKMAEQAGADPNATSIEQAEAIARAQVERLGRLARSYRAELDDLHGGKPVAKGAKPKGGKG